MLATRIKTAIGMMLMGIPLCLLAGLFIKTESGAFLWSLLLLVFYAGTWWIGTTLKEPPDMLGTIFLTSLGTMLVTWTHQALTLGLQHIPVNTWLLATIAIAAHFAAARMFYLDALAKPESHFIPGLKLGKWAQRIAMGLVVLTMIGTVILMGHAPFNS